MLGRFQTPESGDEQLQKRQSTVYQDWIRRYDSLSPVQRQYMMDEVANRAVNPRISVLMFVSDPDLTELHLAVESVISQLYPHWELCIADKTSNASGRKQILETIEQLDSRIKVLPQVCRGGSGSAIPITLKQISGDWVCFLSPRDLLAPHALWFVAEAIVKNSRARLLYSDEDRMDQDGNRRDPRFKPAWNPDFALSFPYVERLAAFESALIKTLDGYCEECPGAEIYDLFLRCTEHVASDQIVHIPRILYHTRSKDETQGPADSLKSEISSASLHAAREHLKRRHRKAVVSEVEGGHRVRYALPEIPPQVSIIIPTRDAADLVRGCIESITSVSTYPNYEVILVDNGSSDPAALRYFGSLKNRGVLVIRDDGPFNYSALNNIAVRQAKGELICLLNNDILAITPDWLEEMVSHAVRDETGVVGAKLLYPDHTIQHAGAILGIGRIAGHAFYRMTNKGGGYLGRKQLTSNYSAVTAACMVVRKAVYTEVNGLDEIDFAVGFNDIDFCLRVQKAGYRNVYTPYAEMYHLESKTRGLDITPEKRSRLQRESDLMTARWGDLLMMDPAYNPNLSLEWGDFGLAFPPRGQPLSSYRG